MITSKYGAGADKWQCWPKHGPTYYILGVWRAIASFGDESNVTVETSLKLWVFFWWEIVKKLGSDWMIGRGWNPCVACFSSLLD